jgi:hypothetical protein
MLPTLEFILREKKKGRLPLLSHVSFCWSVRGVSLLSGEFHDRLCKAIHDTGALAGAVAAPKSGGHGRKGAAVAPAPASTLPQSFVLDVAIHNTGSDAYAPPKSEGKGKGKGKGEVKGDSLEECVQSRRPEPSKQLAVAATEAAKHGGLACALVCGPAGLSNAVMDAAAAHSNVHVHKETFGF